MITRNHILLILLLSLGVYQWITTREITHGLGEVAPDIPIQNSLASPEIFDHLDYELTSLATFDITARVLSKENYYMDKGADLVPTDLTLGWGAMSDEQILNDISIHQSNRFYFWSVKHFPIPQQEIINNSANMHLIPADDYIADKITSLHVGNVVRIVGNLVNVKANDGWTQKTSLTRADSGAGACEIIWVKELSIIM